MKLGSNNKLPYLGRYRIAADSGIDRDEIHRVKENSNATLACLARRDHYWTLQLIGSIAADEMLTA